MNELQAKSKLWTPEDLAGYLGVPVSWIYKRTRKNGPELIPHVKLGKYVRFDPNSEAFQRWLERHEKKPAGSLTIDYPSHKVQITTEKTGHIS
jgi:hypothetical protein